MIELNEDNLWRLVHYICDKVTDDQFSMEYFRANKDYSEELFYSPTNCGTIGCAVGHAPFVKGLEPLEEEYTVLIGSKQNRLDFFTYMRRVFGRSLDMDSFESMFLFDSEWYDVDQEFEISSRKLFINRAKYLLELGTLPYTNDLISVDTQVIVNQYEDGIAYER